MKSTTLKKIQRITFLKYVLLTSCFVFVYMSYITRYLRYWMANALALALCIPLVNWVNRLKNQDQFLFMLALCLYHHDMVCSILQHWTIIYNRYVIILLLIIVNQYLILWQSDVDKCCFHRSISSLRLKLATLIPQSSVFRGLSVFCVAVSL